MKSVPITTDIVGIKAHESLCYLLMYISPSLNKDHLLTYSTNVVSSNLDLGEVYNIM